MRASWALRGVARRGIPFLLVAVVGLLATAPLGLGFSGGIHKDNAPDAGAFAEEGCTACHGGHAFGAGGLEKVSYSIVDAEGNPLAGNRYTHDATYTITITLHDEQAPEAANHAGFNLRASAGALTETESSQVTGDGLEAAHKDAAATSWQVGWTAPSEGVAVFDLFVNDVDGSGAPDETDIVYRAGFWLTDEHSAVPGAVEEHEVHFGISLQQYWIGLIGLAGMIFIMVAGFAYMKFANPHNSDAKDR